MVPAKDQLGHLASLLSEAEAEKLLRAADVLELRRDVPVVMEECLFCRVRCDRGSAPKLGWVPSWWYGTGDTAAEVFLPVCRGCAAERLSYNSESGDYNLKQ